MATFTLRSNKNRKKASEYFLKMNQSLDLEKYKLAKYEELFKLTSFQAMHDADLAYHSLYTKCAECAETKESLINCLDMEERYGFKHPDAFDATNYRNYTLKAISEIRQHLNAGMLDYLYT